MLLGSVEKRMRSLQEGQSVVIDYDAMVDTAKYYLESAFDTVRKEDIQVIVDEVNSKEYPNFSLIPSLENHTWVLNRLTK